MVGLVGFEMNFTVSKASWDVALTEENETIPKEVEYEVTEELDSERKGWKKKKRKPLCDVFATLSECVCAI